MLKKFSAPKIVNILTEVTVRSGLCPRFKRGRPCEVKKERTISFILFFRMHHRGYEQMEQESELYLQHHYDHGNFHYHYTNLGTEVLCILTNLFKEKINTLLREDILFHIFDSTALSTSVREERTQQGLRNKTKLTKKFHTMLGYDPPNQLIVVEAMLASDHHTSDNQGALFMLYKGLKGYGLGDSAYETYELVQKTEQVGLIPLYKPTKKEVKKKLSAKARRRKDWKGNASRWYKEIRGVGEVLYGAATRAGLIHTHSKVEQNMFKDALLIGLRQNVLTYLRLEALMRIIRKTR
jgi:hypothetical protein